MRSSRSAVEARRNLILKSLHETGTINVQQTAKDLGVSPLTVRRDLENLHMIEKIKRVYGGAVLDNKETESDNIFSSGYTQSKLAIARYAAGLVTDGDTIFINTSSTALAIIPFINKFNPQTALYRLMSTRPNE